MHRYYIKLHRRGRDVVLAVCDEELLGKSFSDGRLKIHVKEEFYGGERVGIERVFEAMEEATIINAIGERVVSAITRGNEVLEEAVIRVCGIPHIQIIKF